MRNICGAAFGDKCGVLVLNNEANSDVAKALDIRFVPTFLYFDDKGVPIKMEGGGMEVLRNFYDTHVLGIRPPDDTATKKAAAGDAAATPAKEAETADATKDKPGGAPVAATKTSSEKIMLPIEEVDEEDDADEEGMPPAAP